MTARTIEPGSPAPQGDPQILHAARDELADRGYERMTMTAVAVRAGVSKASLYRRWWSKAELAVDAVALAADAALAIEAVPDTGSLAGDLQALTSVRPWIWHVLPGVVAEAREAPEIAAALRAQLVRGHVDLIRALLDRAVARGELHPDADLELAAQVPAAMIAFRLLVTGEPLHVDFVDKVCDEVLVPLATGRPCGASLPPR